MLTAGEIIDEKYEIIRILGRGGMSTVYLGRHVTLGIERAIKEVCRQEYAGYEELRQRCIREADILKSLDHPGLPEIIDIIIEKDYLLIIMEYISGHTLKELLNTCGVIEEKVAVNWGIQLCEVLSYLHTRNPPVIYRDLKPSNVMRKLDGKIVLIDFGTAREYRGKAAWEDTVCLGTRGYAAPEQYTAGGQSDERTDIYCLGTTLYHLLTGKNPEQPPYEIYPVRRWNPALSPGLEEFIMTCTRRNPEERYQSSEEAGYVLAHLEENTGKYQRQEKMKIYLFVLLILGMAMCVWTVCFCRIAIKDTLLDAVRIYVEQAERLENGKRKEENYIQALKLLPDCRQIYESLLTQYVRTNDFQVGDAVELMNILEMAGKESGSKPVLEILRQQEPKVYAGFCYNVGIGYFFHMGTVEGKKAAQVWFEDAVHAPGNSLPASQRKRALLYKEISSYYNSFLTTGADRSGEQVGSGYADFFDTLCQLNSVTIHENSTPSQAAAVYMISAEVAVEIGSFAFQFLTEGGISGEKLQKELDRIYRTADNDAAGESESNTDVRPKAQRDQHRITILEKFREKEEIDNLKNLVKDAGRKLELAENGLRQGGEQMG